MQATNYMLQSTMWVWLCLNVMACNSETVSTPWPTPTVATLVIPTGQPVPTSIPPSHTPEISTSTPSPVAPGNEQPSPSVSTETPVPLVTTCVPFRPSGWLVYTVQQEDNLFRLGLNGGKMPEELMAVNCLTSTVISLGQTLFIPPSDQETGVNPSPITNVTNTPVSVTPPDTTIIGPPPCGTPPSTPCGALDPTDTPQPQETPLLTLTPPDDATVVPQPFIQQP